MFKWNCNSDLKPEMYHDVLIVDIYETYNIASYVGDWWEDNGAHSYEDNDVVAWAEIPTYHLNELY